MREKRVMEDINGVPLCGYQKKMLSLHATAHITIQDQSGNTFAIATIKRVINDHLILNKKGFSRIL